MFEEGFLAALHKPGGNYQVIPGNREKHLRETGGKVYTRFPPEVCHALHYLAKHEVNFSVSSPTVTFILDTARPLRSISDLQDTTAANVTFVTMIPTLKQRRNAISLPLGRLLSGLGLNLIR